MKLIPTAMTIRIPRTMFCQYSWTASRSKPLVIMASISTPMTVRHTEPTPPKMLLPPSATPAIASSAREPPRPLMLLDPEPVIDESIMPARPQAAPVITKVMITVRSTLRPDRRAALRLSPTP